MRNKKNDPPKPQRGASHIAFHFANTLKLVTDRYETLEASISEIIQNAIDAGGNSAEVEINLRDRRVVVMDNGKGCDQAEFDLKLLNVGVSIGKNSGEDLGQFGLGLLAPADLKKCRRYEFISAPKANKGRRAKGWEGYRRHIFDEVMAHPEKYEEVPWEEDLNLNEHLPSWNTRVVLQGIVLSNLFLKTFNAKRFTTEIGVKYAEKIRRTGVKIKITFVDRLAKKEVYWVEPKTFLGKPLDVYRKVTKEAGEVRLTMYLNDTSGNGTNLVFINGMASLAQLPWNRYRNHIGVREYMTQTAMEVLDSGLFEGQIYAEKCEWRPERDGFKVDESLLDLFIMIDEWAEKVGIKLVNQVRDSHQTDRYERIGRQAVAEVKDLMKNLSVELREEILDGFPGYVSRGHTPVWGKPGETVRTKEPKTRQLETTPRPPTTKPRGERENEIHGGTIDDEGSERTISRRQPGLVVDYQNLGYDVRVKIGEDGKIIINNRHDNFAQCENRRSDAKLKEYVTLLIFYALATAKLSDSVKKINFGSFEKFFFPLMVNKIAPPLKRPFKKKT